MEGVRRRLTMFVNLVLAGAATAGLAVVLVGTGSAPNDRAAAATTAHPAPPGAAPSQTTLPRTVPTVARPSPTTAPNTPPSTKPPAIPRTVRPAVVSPSPRTFFFGTTPTAPATPAPTTTTTSTTIAPIGGHIPVPPSTLPLRTKAQNAHVSPVLAALSGAGFFVALLIMGVSFFMSRPRRRM
jgi:hypothetical protein